jgi:hypothetical protein
LLEEAAWGDCEAAGWALSKTDDAVKVKVKG